LIRDEDGKLQLGHWWDVLHVIDPPDFAIVNTELLSSQRFGAYPDIPIIRGDTGLSQVLFERNAKNSNFPPGPTEPLVVKSETSTT
jgi:hypothetical protein